MNFDLWPKNLALLLSSTNLNQFLHKKMTKESYLVPAIIIIFHTIHLILCIQQAGKIDNLLVSLGQSTLIVLCAGSTSGIIDGATDNLLSSSLSS